jgi:hypothetical protein
VLGNQWQLSAILKRDIFAEKKPKMITINTHTSITSKNPILKIDTTGSVPVGEYDVLIVLEKTQRPSLQLTQQDILNRALESEKAIKDGQFMTVEQLETEMRNW